MKEVLKLIVIFACLPFVYGAQASEYSYRGEFSASLLYNLSISKMEEKVMEEQTVNHVDLAALNEKEFLHLIEVLYIHYIINDLHDEKLYKLTLEIIETDKNRIISHDAFVIFLERILYISDNKHSSEQIIAEIIEKLYSKRKSSSPHPNKALLVSALLNDNPSIIRKLIEKQLIAPDDTNVLDLMFLTHAFVYKEPIFTNTPKQNAVYGDKQLFGTLPQKHYALERKNGVEIAKVLYGAGFIIKSPDKYMCVLRNIDKIHSYSKFKLQNCALPLFEYVSTLGR